MEQVPILYSSPNANEGTLQKWTFCQYSNTAEEEFVQSSYPLQ